MIRGQTQLEAVDVGGGSSPGQESGQARISASRRSRAVGSKSVLDVLKGETSSIHQRICGMADPLHFGTWGRMSTKIVWFLFGPTWPHAPGIVLPALAMMPEWLAKLCALSYKSAHNLISRLRPADLRPPIAFGY